MRDFAGRRWPSQILVVAVALFGVISVVPGLQPAPTTALTTYTRHVSCPGSSFYPIDSATSFGLTNGVYRTRTGAGGTGRFRCDPSIPHGAVVKRVRFTLADQTPAGSVTDCALKRQGLTPSTVIVVNTMASIPSTGIGGQEPFRLSDTSIAFATIDNSQYAYWLECQLPNAVNLGIGGADIQFTITAAKG